MNHMKMLLVLGAIALCQASANSQETRQARGVLVEEVRNEHPDFLVRVDVDQPDRTYQAGEEMRVSVVSARAGYLYLLYCDAGGNVTCLFPNAFGQDNRIAAQQPITIPRPSQPGQSSFRLKIGAPFGPELLKAIVSESPMEEAALARLMTGSNAAERVAGVRGVYAEEVKAATNWAEHHVEITTLATNEAGEPGTTANSDSRVSNPSTGNGPRRVGVFIGISQYADERIKDLTVCENDARTIAQAMRQQGQIGQGWVLLNEVATRQNIEQVLRQKVIAATRPGDSVVIYWSGHGSRCADDGGDEKDGFDEYLVPYDGRLSNLDSIRQSMIMDDTFGRWIQEMDGRRVVVILDMCHSAGQAAGAKSFALPGSESATNQPASGEFDFLDGEFARIKDIGQRDTALLASSAASQVSFERKEHDLSAMTYFLAKQLQAGSTPLTLTDSFAQLKRDVTEYVERQFPGVTQTPVLIDNLSEPFFLRP
ncbi:MAG: caspase family protein [Planctomycetaceae bacterium]|nr:caspase family protein [Planctomycetales bacterium]MCB9922625.1 caspase family protein [Planctomycetaceae bacterium]